ncbi:MAG: site-specific DNA-methyltransferase [Selenomonadaceae bacterium]|nr:site-specific DNA-methyltransferase [Selenomonadaceae bacterium]
MKTLPRLINEITDVVLREKIQIEFNRLTQKFGLVFESKDEFFPRADLPVKKFSLVAKVGDIDKTFRVTDIDGDKIFCSRDEKTFEFSRQDLICVSRLGEAIYPGLTRLDEVYNAPDSSLWHMLIEAENYHALQLLKYPFAGKVDCIYIDPPYNTGARDWKYNNAFVDAADRFSHSKWLSMMERRLKLAKDLLNPADSVLIVTIDEHEYLHLGCLLEEMFGGAQIQMVSSVINPAGVSRNNMFARTNEYIFFVMFGSCRPLPLHLSNDWRGNIKGGYKDKLRWNGLQRSGTGTLRKDRPNMFYPIYLDASGKKILGAGDSLPLETPRSVANIPEGVVAVWPIFPDGREGRWRLGRETFLDLAANHFVKVGGFRGERTTITYLAEGERSKVERGDFSVTGYADDGSVIVDEGSYVAKFVPGTQWWINSHDATQQGTKILNAIIGGSKFAFPKSLYAVRDALKFFVANKPDALIVDFFAGSGTTLHAVNLLNAEDGGKRRCVLVTNNEGDIARSVTWPRTVCSVEGHDINGTPLKGNYLGSEREMSDGFKANAAFFALKCLDKNSVELGEQFNQTLPVLWLKAGGHGRCPTFEAKTLPPYKIFAENKFAVLFDESHFADFAAEVDNAQIETFFAVTGSDASLNDMAKQLHVKRSFRLYEDYLENFKLEEVTP